MASKPSCPSSLDHLLSHVFHGSLWDQNRSNLSAAHTCWKKSKLRASPCDADGLCDGGGTLCVYAFRTSGCG